MLRRRTAQFSRRERLNFTENRKGGPGGLQRFVRLAVACRLLKPARPPLGYGQLRYLRQIRPADSANGNVLFDVPPAHFKLRIQDEQGQRAALIDIPLSFNSETPDIPAPDRK